MEQHTHPTNEYVSVGSILTAVGHGFRFLVTNWWKLAVASLAGLGLGVLTASLIPISYKADIHFMVEESKGGSGAGIAALAGQFGFDLGGIGGSGGLLSGDNVLIFLKSKSLIREALLTAYDSSGSTSLADKYAESTGLKKTWEKKFKEPGTINFPSVQNAPTTRLQDSLLQVITEKISKNDLLVDKPDKKASFVLVSANMRDELLTKLFTERLVKKATDRYVNAKTERQFINVQRLQKRADSIAILLNSKTYNAAVVQEQLIDINPGMKAPMAKAEVSGRDKMMLSTIYGEVVKNLEISKVALSQETPTIQIIDTAILPLKQNKVSRLLGGIVGAALAVCLVAFYLTILYWVSHKTKPAASV
ncbi:hypothetical protein [Flavihumibacter sp. CACIAM 22H1]|uniref:hypothetical protein n=1 Tax=Flavihumibacter sp. CACIAM 22H1 TaxID=1812911 RepID=UPI0007A8648C|nr:hypothetical protein [Flavihumibacter sp. CACIAM 22H1]KYP15963.1 MAG: hypothetical protein A1D16_06785 [Flavihumibacter sp. CACIAM 22H1]